MIDGYEAAPAEPVPGRRTAWISSGLEQLARRLGTEAAAALPTHFDVVIVGSGYGGAIAAERLAGLRRAGQEAPLRLCVLERGREYLPGAFPSRMADLGGHVRFTTPAKAGAKGRLEGLFDVRVGQDMSVLLANGVGGGSLINAGVMEFPSPAIFADPAWPPGLPTYDELSGRAYEIRQELGAGSRSAPNQIDPASLGAGSDRLNAMVTLGGRAVPITVALKQGHLTSGNVQLSACIGCGDCATGCNHSAKDSLDVNLLRRAAGGGAELYTGATVTRVRRVEDAWELEVWHTDAALRQRMAGALRLRADKVVLAAGTLGSTEILLRSQTDDLRFSDRLGQGFSGNGDIVAALYDASRAMNGVADEVLPPKQRNVGPTITAMVDGRDQRGEGFVAQDLGVPGALRRLFEEASTTSWLLHQLGRADDAVHDPQANDTDRCAVDPAKIGRSVAMALIGRDSAAGVLSVLPDDPALPGDTGVRIDWPRARQDERIAQAQDWLAGRVEAAGLGGQVLPNPMWRLLPEDMEQMLGARRGPLLTVHPLGGCPMGRDRRHGVVNERGEVYDRHGLDDEAVHPGLMVLDGAIIPVSLGINPALTIATLADVAIEQLIDRWDLDRPAPDGPPLPKRCARPIFRALPDPRPPQETKVQVVEQLTGWVRLEGADRRVWVELSLAYADKALFPQDCSGQRKAFTMAGHVLPVAHDPALSRVRVFASRGSKYASARRPDQDALLVAPLLESSWLRFFHQERSTRGERIGRAWWAWLRNRGMRDGWQEAAQWLSRRDPGSDAGRLGQRTGLSIWKRFVQSLSLASRAGAVRLFDYQLDLGAPSRAAGPFAHLAGRSGLRIAGRKRLTYERRCNPWEQLMRLELTEFMGMRLERCRHLTVNPIYFAQKQVALARIVAQQDQPGALADTLAFLLYCARLLIDVHLWSFRKPDRPGSRPAQRLPGRLPGLPAPALHEFVPDGATEGVIRLTCYPGRGAPATRRPVLMIHGYSASGTTFAHPSVDPNLAGHLWREGFEPWIVDLRTSCGMPTADKPWTFEQIALADVPAAVRFVCARTGAARIDVVSHCMGSAMLAMTLLSDEPSAHQTADRLGRWVASQVGPAMYFSPANIFRSYLVRYVRHLLPELQYSLRPGGEVPGFDADMFDRLVASLPYLNDARGSEFDIENPSWLRPWRRTPWVGTRHRLDALIGRTFDARRMSPAALDHIDDFFGPISLATVSQPVHFAREGFVTSHDGWERFLETRLVRLAHLRMLSLHGCDNGLADWETGRRLRELAKDRGLRWQVRFVRDHGHQDCLIGRDCLNVFKIIDSFLKTD